MLEFALKNLRATLGPHAHPGPSKKVGRERFRHRAAALEYGMVGINAGVIATEHAPLGGVEQSA